MRRPVTVPLRALPVSATESAVSAEAQRDPLFAQQLERLSKSWIGLPDKQGENPGTTLRALWRAVSGSSDAVRSDEPEDLPLLPAGAEVDLLALVDRRISGVPLAHLIGRQGFLGLEFRAGKAAMIPRVETELLARTAIVELQALVLQRRRVQVIDLCTGSGNVGLSLAHFVPECEVTGSDLSEAAVDLARENARMFALDGRVRFRVGDLFAPFELAGENERVDLITCNPPYISSAKVPEMAEEISRYEPREAFDGGRLGTDVLLRLYSQAPRFLKPASVLCFEVGVGQGDFVARRMEKSGAYDSVRRVRDELGEIRVLVGRTP